MIINSHVHMVRLGKEFSDELADYYVHSTEGTTCWYTGEAWRKQDFCVSAERLIADMDRLGIDKSFVLRIAFLPYNAHDLSAAEYAAEMVDGYPERLIGFFTADPTGGYSEAKRFERSIEELKLSGLKLLPSGNGLALNDRKMWPLFEVAEGHGVPVVMHTGWNGFPRGRVLQWEHPMYLEDVVLNHAFNATTITFTSHVQVLSTSAACILALQGHPDYLADDYVTTPMDYSGGKIAVGDRPGLGLELDPDKVKRYHAAYEREGQAVSYAGAKAGLIRTIPHL
jgi:hypothetical protein